MTRQAIEYLSNGLILKNKLNNDILSTKKDLSNVITDKSDLIKNNFQIKFSSAKSINKEIKKKIL